MPCSSLTECWVGLVLCSSLPRRKGTSVTWMKSVFSFPCSRLTCRAASRKGWLSISPVVPPISVMTTSACVSSPTR